MIVKFEKLAKFFCDQLTAHQNLASAIVGRVLGAPPPKSFLQHIGSRLSEVAKKKMGTRDGKEDDLTILLSEIKKGQSEEEHPSESMTPLSDIPRDQLCREITGGKAFYCTSFVPPLSRAVTSQQGVSSQDVAQRLRSHGNERGRRT